MRYVIDFNKTVNQLLPHYLRGRKLVLLIQSLVAPLKAVNEVFSNYAKETRIEACMTSQTFYFEWYLNRQLGKYFADPEARISITTQGQSIGTPLYNESAENIPNERQVKLYYQEGVEEEGDWIDEETPREDLILYSSNDTSDYVRYSFIVTAPLPDLALITTKQYEGLLKNYIEKYRIANKTYTINYY